MQINSHEYDGNESKYLRARFYQVRGSENTAIESVWCEDFFADKIAVEKDLPQIQDNTFYMRTFVNSTWICPNIQTLEVDNYDTYIVVNINSCPYSK